MTKSIILSVALIVASIVDLRARRLPDWITLPLVAIGLVLSALGTQMEAFEHAAAAAVGYLAFWFVAALYRFIRGHDGIGFGDAKLLAAAGAWLGLVYLAPVVLLGALLALMCALALRLSGRQLSWQSTLPFGPFLSAGFICCWFAKLANWSLF